MGLVRSPIEIQVGEDHPPDLGRPAGDDRRRIVLDDEAPGQGRVRRDRPRYNNRLENAVKSFNNPSTSPRYAWLLLGFLTQLSIVAVASAGFALLQPASTIQEVLAADDGTSPIAVAHEMARRNGTPVGGSALPRVFPVVGAALLALVDARRRPRAASLAFGAGLLIVMLPRMLGSSPVTARISATTA